ncbi:hypothetical protein L6164_025663 [Bauhinia variegata]|uniref:Uncharacterized protein n=1 Tax=Bauhinia variegata TaxID=167791 RepID=A0ACB9M172_BAUVA|nr:hypothetical protein L6164_025663 [Bauhinia variegata]
MFWFEVLKLLLIALSLLDCFCNITDKLQSRSNLVLPSPEASSSRRHLLVSSSTSLVTMTLCHGLSPLLIWAEEEDDKGIIGAIRTLFDPNEKTKSGKVLPKAYLKSAREVVKTLRESLNEDPKDNAKFRTADATKESIREYLSSWKGQHTIAHRRIVHVA